ncbi:MAG: restriction endonuclease subunit S [Gammaproteobacteria bacterium]|nr:restriction endonuclease subunit S [Gammaproteobacteria bacterium]
MELKPGYKQTEVGIIPKEWDVPHLRLHLLQDATYGVVKAGTFQRIGILMIRGGDIKAGAITGDQPLISVEKSREYSRTILKERDVVIALVGYPGESAVVPTRLVGANISRAVGLLRPAETLLPEFLACYLNSPNGRKEFLRPSAGSAQIVVNLGALNQLRIPLPDDSEQRAIATALSDVDTLLGALDRLIAKKRDLRQAAMQQLLTGQTRLPGFHGEWEVKRLGNTGDIKSGGTPSTSQPQFWDGEVPWCTPTDITALGDHKYLTETSRSISDAGVKASSAEVIPPRSLIITSRATIGECAINVMPMTTNQGFKNVVPFPEIDVEFLYYLMTMQKAGLISLCAGSTFLEISKKQLSAYEITLPRDRSEQTAIATVLSDMDADLAVLEARRDKTRALKQGMMQVLLTGVIRLV